MWCSLVLCLFVGISGLEYDYEKVELQESLDYDDEETNIFTEASFEHNIITTENSKLQQRFDPKMTLDPHNENQLQETIISTEASFKYNITTTENSIVKRVRRFDPKMTLDPRNEDQLKDALKEIFAGRRFNLVQPQEFDHIQVTNSPSFIKLNKALTRLQELPTIGLNQPMPDYNFNNVISNITNIVKMFTRASNDDGGVRIPTRINLDGSGVNMPTRINLDKSGVNMPTRINLDGSSVNMPTRINIDSSGAMIPTKINHDDAGAMIPTRINPDDAGAMIPTRINPDDAGAMIPTRINPDDAGAMIPTRINHDDASAMIPTRINHDDVNEKQKHKEFRDMFARFKEKSAPTAPSMFYVRNLFENDTDTTEVKITTKSRNYRTKPTTENPIIVQDKKKRKNKKGKTDPLTCPTLPTTTTTTGTTTTGRTTMAFDVEKFLEIVANLTYDYYTNLTQQLNMTLQKMSPPTCPTPTLSTEVDYSVYNDSLRSKCFVCGMTTPGVPWGAECADAFAGDFIPLVPQSPKAKGHIGRFRKYCLFQDINNFYINDSMPRMIFGRWTGGCSVRWTDVSGVYTQRTCRSKFKAVVGKSYASKRMAKLEMTLQHTENGCVISPVATLLPLSRAISLYARFHVCVCSGNWCNTAPAPLSAILSALPASILFTMTVTVVVRIGTS